MQSGRYQFSRTSRATRLARIGLAGTTAALAVLATSSSAWAACSESFPGIQLTGPAGNLAVTRAFPLGSGSAIGSLTSSLNAINTAFLTTTSAFVTSPSDAKPNQFGSGGWVRGVGGESTVTTDSVGTLARGTNTGVAGLSIAGSTNCANSVQQSYAGFQVGYDIQTLNFDRSGWNMTWGITAGKLFAGSKDKSGPGTFQNGGAAAAASPASALETDTGTTFVGLYAAFTKGGFFFDGQLRADFHETSGSDPVNTPAPFSFDGRGIAVTANAGYNMPLKNGWFIEPSGGLVVSRTGFDTVTIATRPAEGIGGGTVSVDDVTSVMGRASLRLGTNFTHDKITYQPYFTYSLFHEFAGDVSATSIAANPGTFNGNGLVLTTSSSGGLGTYSQFALGTAVVLTPKTIAYLRGDYKIGDNVEGWGISGGIRYQFAP